MLHRQKSKLIIFFMTKTPIDIQHDAADQHQLAGRMGPKQRDVVGLVR